jgi:branched-chain amino acid transport system ATP-binding protein
VEFLEVQGISVKRGSASVLRDVSFAVGQREIVTILGSNGVGKSTALRTISGLHRPSSGTITHEGVEISLLTPRDIVRRGISHVPEGRLVFPGLTVLENLQMGAFSVGRLERGELEAVFDRFPVLREFKGKNAGALSGGQQQMLALARGIAAKPRLLLLDEPSLGLAPVIILQIAEILRELRDDGMTILLVEQNAGLALSVADRGYVMVEGAVAFSGSTDELRADDRVQRAYLGL